MAETEEKVVTNAPINAVFESEKLLYDAMKHLTTLSSGSILLIMTLVGTVFRDYSSYRGLIAGAVGCFVVSIICSISLMLQVTNHIARTGEKFSIEETSIRDIAHYASAGLFALGYVFFIVFVLIWFFPRY